MTKSDPFANIEQARKVGFNATEKHMYRLGVDVIVVEIMNTGKRYLWRMLVNDEPSPVSGNYERLLHFKGYSLATEFWEGAFTPLVPFQAVFANKIAELQEKSEEKAIEPLPANKATEQSTIKLEKKEQLAKAYLHELPIKSKFRYKGWIYVLLEVDEFFQAVVKTATTGAVFYFNACIVVEPISD